MATKKDERDEKAKLLGAIKCIEVDKKRLYLKNPPRSIVGIAFAQNNVNPVQAAETLVKACAIRDISDMEILENDTLFLSVMANVMSFLSEIELKKSDSRNL